MDVSLIKALARAHRWRRMLESGEARSIAELARRLGCNERYVSKVLRLAFLAPDIAQAILDGRQPRRVTVTHVIGAELPLSWNAQRKRLGFPIHP